MSWSIWLKTELENHVTRTSQEAMWFGRRFLFTVICKQICSLDLRNHGRSPHSPEMGYVQMANDVLHLSNTLDLDDVCIVGHSMGGKTAMCAALLKVS